MLTKARIAVFVSGGGTNLEALLNAQERGDIPHGEIVLVCASNENAYALTRAKNHGVPGVAVPKKQMTQEAFESALNEKLTEYRVDVIILAGFLSILSADFVKHWPDRIINIHPALIPSFCGPGMYGHHVHEAVLAYGAKISGATTHFVDEQVDHGGVIMQRAIEVKPDDNPDTLRRRVLEEGQWKILPQSVALYCQGRLSVRGNRVVIEEKEE